MKQQDRSPKQALRPTARLGALAAALLCLGLLSASPASANYEQVDTFSGTPGALHGDSPAEWPEEVQLAGLGGMAVNRTGAGGVPPGTVYAAVQAGPGSPVRVARFNPDGSFSERWTFEGSPPDERCGPDGDPAHPVCKSANYGGTSSIDVDIDQSTGYVYLFAGGTLNYGKAQIHVYSADGSELISEFGVKATDEETVATSPEKIHGTLGGGLALGPDGEAYVSDQRNPENRLMTFKPQSPGDYEHYVYAGQASDIPGEVIRALYPVADDAGYLYVAGGVGDSIAKLDPGNPADPVLCQFNFPKGGITAITVNPESGEVFFFTYKDKKIHRLAPCEEGEFAEAGVFAFSPLRSQLTAMAFDPGRQFGPGRPSRTLYAGAPNGEGGKTEPFKSESAMGYVFAPPVELDPEVLSESVERVTATTADLTAQINPKGPPTTFTFQYISQADYEANEPTDRFAGAAESPPGGALLGEGPDALSASTSLNGLEPDTTYHYRAVATNHCSEELPEKACEDTGSDQAFHTFPIETPGLPDKRAWEMVSPPQKQGGQVLPADPSIFSCGTCKPGGTFVQFPRQSSPDGEAVVYQGSAFASGEGAVSENQYISRRDGKAGWQTVNLTPTLINKADHGYRAFDISLGVGLLGQSDPTFSPQAPAGYLNFYTQPTADPLAFTPLLTAEPPHRPAGRGAGEFELTYAGASADLSRIFFAANDALTGETAFAPEAVDGGASKDNLYEWAGGQLRLVNVAPGNLATEPGAAFGTTGANAISADGSRAFFSDEAGQLYVRVNGEATVEIQDPGKFLSASTDGSKVLLDDGCLYDLAEEECTDLSADQSDVHKGGFKGIAGQSDDLSHVYFVDTEVLTGEEENSEGYKAGAGELNLYAWAQGAGTRFVATLVAKDNDGTNLVQSRVWSPQPAARTAEASPGGRFLAFLSQAQLTGYENTGPCSRDPEGGRLQAPCPEAFLYDSATGELSCASCNPTGTRPLGFSVLRRINGGVTTALSLPQPRYLNDEGRLYFDSGDSLSPFDTNNGFEDVYQYEPEGIGTCERVGGCVSLISAGSEPEDSNFLAMDEDGSNVFFTTRDQLLLKDHDDLIDLYDARTEGGIPSETETARGECQGEACAAALVAPNDPTPGSSSFEGAGNVDEKKATKKHKHKRKHAKHKSHKRSHGRAAKHNRGGSK